MSYFWPFCEPTVLNKFQIQMLQSPPNWPNQTCSKCPYDRRRVTLGGMVTRWQSTWQQINSPEFESASYAARGNSVSPLWGGLPPGMVLVHYLVLATGGRQKCTKYTKKLKIYRGKKDKLTPVESSTYGSRIPPLFLVKPTRSLLFRNFIEEYLLSWTSHGNTWAVFHKFHIILCSLF